MRMIAVTLPFFSYLFQGSLGSKSKVDCIATNKVWTTGMLVVVEGPPVGLDKICLAKFEQNGQPKDRSNSASKMGCQFCQKSKMGKE